MIDDKLIAHHLFRVAQEAFHNALRDGQATEILVELSKLDDKILLRIKDDGVGIQSKSRAETKGIGLQTMAYRVAQINGSVEINPGLEGGTEVTCLVPQR